jgi:site-specific DNA recombinase
MTKDEIRTLVGALGNISAVLASAEPEDKAEVYRQLGTKLIYEPNKRLVRAEAGINPQPWGYGKCPRGDLNPHAR